MGSSLLEGGCLLKGVLIEGGCLLKGGAYWREAA